jgi:hypothetical protein
MAEQAAPKLPAYEQHQLLRFLLRIVPVANDHGVGLAGKIWLIHNCSRMVAVQLQCPFKS